jgi:hypothetical protein
MQREDRIRDMLKTLADGSSLDHASVTGIMPL